MQVFSERVCVCVEILHHLAMPLHLAVIHVAVGDLVIPSQAWQLGPGAP